MTTTYWSSLPQGTFYPMFIVATLAAIIASQVCSPCCHHKPSRQGSLICPAWAQSELAPEPLWVLQLLGARSAAYVYSLKTPTRVYLCSNN